MQIEELYFAPEDLYRLGNSVSPRLTNVRQPKDIDTRIINGIQMAVANRKGLSLSTKSRLEKDQMSGWVWKLARGTIIPARLKLINDRPGHYSVCPAVNMPLDEFTALLAVLSMRCHKVFKKEAI